MRRRASKRRRSRTPIWRSSTTSRSFPSSTRSICPAREPEEARRQIEEIIGLDGSGAILTSAKEGIGITDVLEAVVASPAAAEGRRVGAAEGADLRLVVRPVSRRRDRRAGARRHAAEGHEDPPDGAGAGLRDRSDRRVLAEARADRRAGRRRGRLHRREHQDRERREDRRHDHRDQPAGGAGVSRLQGAEADGVRGPLSGREPSVLRAARGAREAAAERRVVLLRARNVGRAGVRIPLRLPRACCTWRSCRSGSSASSTWIS